MGRSGFAGGDVATRGKARVPLTGSRGGLLSRLGLRVAASGEEPGPSHVSSHQ